MENKHHTTTDPRGFVTVELGMEDRGNMQHAGAKRLDRSLSGVQLVSSWWLALSHDAPEGIGIAGVKYVLMSRESRLRRLGWLVILMVAMTIVSYEIVDRGIYFSTGPLSVNIAVNQSEKELTFPKVVVCNYNIYVKSKMQALPAVDKVLRNYEYHHYDPNRTIALTPEEVSEVKATDTARLLEQVAHEKEHMFLRANFAGKPINLDDIVPVFTKEGRCFEINDGLNGTELLKSKGIGRAFGMTLVLNTEQDEYYYNKYLNDAAGFIIQLLDQDEVPQVLEQGFDVGPGTLTSVAIMATQHIYEKPPYGVCGEKKEKFYEKYSQQKCDLECTTDYVVGECGCRTAYMPGNATVCDPITTATCTTFIIDKGHGEYDNCTCPIECEKKTFSASLSSAKYPSDFRANLFEEYLNESVLNFPSLKRADSSFIKDNFVAVDLFFSSLGTNVITQQASYTIVSFMCDAGGAMGLWLGGSLLTLYEIIDLCGHSFFSTRHP
ncbi:acid-sensing ion channel 1B [Strongylocentrotus purpuratus]|uniref:Uncharacterized protein n=1 Tax=Strongylocentrotus purpuratus TaxID=7668 RepID=A0A7M7NNF5_STRPU|nr:acid-sensing ion channel 1B [Strongylocentrotus purpuratus]